MTLHTYVRTRRRLRGFGAGAYRRKRAVEDVGAVGDQPDLISLA